MTLIVNVLHKGNPYYQMFTEQGYWEILRYKLLQRPWLKVLSKLKLISNPRSPIQTHVKGVSHPVFFRHESSDSYVLYEIFASKDYACVEGLEQPKLIIDCGANVGYAAMYLLEQYPQAHIICVEPDSENFSLCEKNLAPYRQQVSMVKSGIWSHSAGLVVERQFDRGEWGIQVREAKEQETPDLQATDIVMLLNQSGFDQIDLLKVDIEGAEVVLFSSNTEAWLPKVKNLVIELHNPECHRAFFDAIANYDYELLEERGEVMVCKNLRLKGS